MREAITKSDCERAKEIAGLVAASVLQVRGFFKQALTEDELEAMRLLLNPATVTKLAIGDSVEITLSGDYQGLKGVIANISYGTSEISYYVKLDSETAVVSVPYGSTDLVVFAHLRKL